MNRQCLCLILLGAAFISVTASSYDSLGDYWSDEDYAYAEPLQDNPPPQDEGVENLDETDKRVDDEIQLFRNANEANADEPVREIEPLQDYLSEDNRSNDKEDLEEGIESKIESIDKVESDEADEIDFDEPLEEDAADSNIDDNQDNVKQDEVANDYALLWGDVQEQAALSAIKDNEQKMLEETKAILEADSEQNIDLEKKVEDEPKIDEKLLEETKTLLEDGENTLENNVDDKNAEAAELDEQLEKAKEILEDIDNNFNVDTKAENNEEESENIQSSSEAAKDVDSILRAIEEADSDETNLDIQGGDEGDDVISDNENEDTVDKVYADLNTDLEKLLETIDKLSDNDDKEPVDQSEVFNDAMNMDPLEYEEKYGRPYREGVVLAMRDDYQNMADSIFEDDKSDDDSIDVLESDVESEKAEDLPDIEDAIDTANELFPDDGSIFMDASEKPIQPLVYAEDAFVDSDKETEKSTTEFPKVSVDDLSSAELEDLMQQFSALHKDELETRSQDVAQHVAPVHIMLSEEPVVVTSPNYPSPYPTNNIIDWIFVGEGTGIELNITDFAINSALGDYLLVKPGGLDETGTDGLIFSYRLNSEKRYRFTDVDRMFVRFESKLGMAFLRGFKFSVRMISPPPTEPEPIPDPEPIVPPPRETLTLNLGGLTLEQFRDIQDQFRLLIADMATEYINANNIDPGLNSTVDITQITSTSLCNIHWPESESCSEVTFGVPLWYEGGEPLRLTEEDLKIMWRTYINRDPFALRLSRLGITEFSIPNDKLVLAAWLAIGGGIVLCMAAMAFALWRFSCSENYTRMKSSSDTASVVDSKRGLDLYPTPHQSLPPLYSEQEYKWPHDNFTDSTRDMGGFANKSYSRDLFEYDSDEDIITPRDSTYAKQKEFIKNV